MKDVQLYIDGNEMEIDENTVASITLSVSEITNPDNTQIGHTKTIDIPATPRNRIVMRFTEQVFSKERFNNAEHTGVIECNGVKVMSGVVELKSFKDNNKGEAYYSIVIMGATLEWARRAEAKISELTSDYTVKYLLDRVYTNSVATSRTLIKFAPIDKGAFYTGDDLKPRTSLVVQDYHPFINVLLLLELILKGYTVRTSIREQLGKLYVSGYIPELTDDSVKEDNDFFAGSTDLMTVTQYSTFASYFNVGAFWDRTSGDFFGDEVVVFADLTPSSRSHIAFSPTTKVTAAFKITLTYSSTVLIRQSDGRFTFVDKVLFGGIPYEDLNTAKQSFTIDLTESTRYKDKTSEIPPPAASAANTQNYVMFIKFKDPSAVQNIMLLGASLSNYLLLSQPSMGGDFCIYAPMVASENARIYITYKNNTSGTLNINDKTIVDECYFFPMDYRGGKNRLLFSKELTTDSYTIDQGEKFPLTLAFGASTPGSSGMWLELSDLGGCKIKPDFGGIGTGDDVSISTIGGDTTQLEFIQAIRQMFNLNFYTNPVTKEVFIEPGSTFCKSVIDPSVRLNDWTGKIDYLKSVEVEELGSDIGNSVKLAYKEGGDVIKIYNRKNKTNIGVYTEALQNKTTGEAKEIVNPLYAPSVTRTVGSMGFTIIQCAPEKEKTTIQDAGLNIDPIIVSFAGLAQRTAGDDRNIRPMYPLMLFQSHEQSVNVGFNDISGDNGTVEGLRQYYRNDIELWNNGRRITLYAKLEPRDIEPFLYPNNDFRDFRGRFKVKVNGEDVLCRIEKISDYNPNSGESTKIEVITGILPYDGELPTERVFATWEGFVNALEWQEEPGPGPEPTETARATWEDFVNVLEWEDSGEPDEGSFSDDFNNDFG